MISWPVAWSRLPVGSSARTIAGHHQGPGDRDALLLAAGQLAGPVGHPVAEAHHAKHGRGGLPPAPGRNPLVEQGGRHVVQRAQRLEHEELLEDDADSPGAQAGELAVGQRGHVFARDPDRPRGGAFKAGGQVEQGALARARRADDGGKLAGHDVQGHAAHGLHRRCARVALADLTQASAAVARACVSVLIPVPPPRRARR